MEDRPEYSSVQLQNINNGAACELFEEAFRKVMANVNDLNVDADFTREITLKIRIKPTKDRSSAVTSVQCDTRLAPLTKHEGSVFFAFRSNKPEAYVSNRRQMEIDFGHRQANDKTDE